MTNPDPKTAGPNNDGSQSLARESKFGVLGAAVASAALFAVADWLGKLDVTPLPDWMENTAAAALAAVAGLAIAWATRNGPKQNRY
jgi:membrane protease YdiL (CAAX protease family)